MFHYALNPKGLLFLGQSESLGIYQDNFRPLSKTGKIYEVAFVGKKVAPSKNLARQIIADYVPNIQAKPPAETKKENASPLNDLIGETLQKTMLPYAILINENMDIVYTHGKNPLMVRPEGIPTNNIYQNLHPTLSIDLRSAVHILNAGQPSVNTAFQRISLEEELKWTRLNLIDIPHQPGMGRLILIFCQIEDSLDLPLTTGDEPVGDNTLAKEQERQLLKAKEQLQTIIEELETSNEEMQSMNEELQSSNEELQSSNEELETTNEELQSTNEELQTAYAELRMAYDEKAQNQLRLNELSSELERTNNLLEETESLANMGSWLWNVPEGTITWSKGIFAIFKKDLEKFTPSYEAFIGLAHPEWRNALEEYFTDLLSGKTTEPYVYRAYDDNRNEIWVSLESVVSFSAHKQANKVIGSIKNITKDIEIKNSLEKNRRNLKLFSIPHSMVFIFMITKRDLNIFMNPAYTKLLGYTLEDINQLTGEEFMGLFHPDDVNSILTHMDEVKNSKLGDCIPLKYRFKHKHTQEFLTLLSNDTLFEVDDETGEPISMLGTFFIAPLDENNSDAK
ncbi:PAS domain-containing protein [Psychromonas sp. KJ10-10]|uniref:PAS domain-containing protein n=1 Tax=Psychromonas sp. KJ10-10 TaxID=3391823 RepID=UPI0039B6A20A